MGLVLDVKHEVAALDVSRKALRKFGLMVGSVFLLLAFMAARKHWDESFLWTFVAVGAPLLLLGLLVPGALNLIYRVWMTLSLAIGWCMSRILLTVMFFVAIVPVALLGRILGLPFARMRRPEKQDSYWVERKPRPANHHEEMF